MRFVLIIFRVLDQDATHVVFVCACEFKYLHLVDMEMCCIEDMSYTGCGWR